MALKCFLRQPSFGRNIRIISLRDLPGKFQAGSCIEVIEHLTPKMAAQLAADLAAISDPEAIYIFNTGMVEFVRTQKPDYLDPYRRGHIVSWSIAALKKVFEPSGFTVFPIRGKQWAFIVEYQSKSSPNTDIRHRIWTPDPKNKEMLFDRISGSVLYVLGVETARAYN
jgi:hypothetical protein